MRLGVDIERERVPGLQYRLVVLLSSEDRFGLLLYL